MRFEIFGITVKQASYRFASLFFIWGAFHMVSRVLMPDGGFKYIAGKLYWVC